MSKNVLQVFDKLLLHLSQIERERNGQVPKTNESFGMFGIVCAILPKP